MEGKPQISVIVPVFNAEAYLGACLGAILASTQAPYEVIVVNDGSDDQSGVIARQLGAEVIEMPRRSGPAAARNRGAEKALGEVLLFVDADVVLRPETLSRVADHFSQEPSVAAVFGSYDDSPAEQNLVSQYKNLFHHFVHQHSNPEAETFWAGCGALRRNLFFEVEGFDEQRYRRPSIEDIELGYRMRARGYRILLDKEMQTKHLKFWTLQSLVRTDIFNRAIPWTWLILERRQLVNDLNLRVADRVSSGLVGLMVGALAISLWMPALLILVPALMMIFYLLNKRLFRFFLEKRGWRFFSAAFLLHHLYFFYSGMTFLFCWCGHITFGNTGKARASKWSLF